MYNVCRWQCSLSKTTNSLQTLNVCGCSLAVTSSGPGGFMFFVVLCPDAPEGSTSSGSGFKVSQKKGPGLKLSSNRLGELGIELGTLCRLEDFCNT